MSSIKPEQSIIKEYLNINLDQTNKFIKYSLKIQKLSSKTEQACKNILSSYVNQEKLFRILIDKLRDSPVSSPKRRDSPESESKKSVEKLEDESITFFDMIRESSPERSAKKVVEESKEERIMKKAEAIFQIIKLRPMVQKRALASALEQHMNAHIIKKPKEDIQGIPHRRFSRIQESLEAQKPQGTDRSKKPSGIGHVMKLPELPQRAKAPSSSTESPVTTAPQISPIIIPRRSPRSPRNSLILQRSPREPLHERGRSKSEGKLASTGNPIDSEKPTASVSPQPPKEPLHVRKRSSMDESKLISSKKPSSLDSILSSPRDKLESRQNSKLQKTLKERETDFKEFISTRLDISALESFIKYWGKTDLKGEEVENLIKMLLSIRDKLIDLKKTPLLGLLLQEKAVRDLKVFPAAISTWAEDLVRQARYITKAGEKSSNPSAEIEFFRHLLTTILDNLYPDDTRNLKSLIMSAWAIRSNETFLKDLINKKLFSKEALDKIFGSSVRSAAQDLNNLGVTLGYVLYSFGQHVYRGPSTVVHNLVQIKGYLCKYRPGAEGRSIKYSFTPDDKLKVETTILMDFSPKDPSLKPLPPSFSIVLRNTLESYIPSMPNWESKISLEVLTQNQKDLDAVKTPVVKHLSRLGFETTASSLGK